MKHNWVMIDLSEWFSSQESVREPIDALTEYVTFISQHGYDSLEASLSGLFEEFLGQKVDQRECLTAASSGKRLQRPRLYVSCLKKNDALIFVDVEPLGQDMETGKAESYTLEADIFCQKRDEMDSLSEQFIELCMKCFGLTGPKDHIVIASPEGGEADILKDRLTLPPAVESKLHERLREAFDRAVLIELKKKSPVLERDLPMMAVPGAKRERIRPTLDYFSGEEYRLVDRKFAIICKESDQIIFLLDSKEEMDSAAKLQCPKCSKRIQDELVMGYYATTQQLKELIDGSKWMPYLVKDAFVKAGVPADDILVGAKYGEDEIDLLAFFRGRIFVVEAKDRPVTLNDAYKLSAKTARLEAVMGQEPGRRAGRLQEDIRRSVEYRLYRQGAVSNIRARRLLVPVIISTQDIAQDGQDLLKDTRANSHFLENCEDRLEAFVEDLVGDIELAELRRRFGALIGADPDFKDATAECTAAVTVQAFSRWLDQGLT